MLSKNVVAILELNSLLLNYEKQVAQLSLATVECLTLTPSLEVIPCEYPDKLYLSRN